MIMVPTLIAFLREVPFGNMSVVFPVLPTKSRRAFLVQYGVGSRFVRLLSAASEKSLAFNLLAREEEWSSNMVVLSRETFVFRFSGETVQELGVFSDRRWAELEIFLKRRESFPLTAEEGERLETLTPSELARLEELYRLIGE
jgi:hypothetical protein